MACCTCFKGLWPATRFLGFVACCTSFFLECGRSKLPVMHFSLWGEDKGPCNTTSLGMDMIKHVEV